ncbi:MAG: ABC transporter permease [Micrococcales bacterium]|jgi:ribose/xylose/arabinose/galactoside ABC-type transport system permease subunit|nr:ABC transporter permease [Micrococcales bacterium]MBT5431481.1 ABC transporter permease [Micrococcales bacterium]
MTNQTVIKVGTDATGFWGKLKVALARRTEGRGVALFIVIASFATVSQPLVFTAYQVTLGRIALIGLVALGLTAVILMGELDLSVASTLAVSGVIMTTVANQTNIAIGILAALAASVVISLVNAYFVAIVGLNSFIATLGMLFALRGLALVLSDEQPVKLENTDFGIAFGQPLVGPLTPRILIFFAVFIAIQVFVSRVKAGREFLAVGGNRQAAYDAGIPVKRRIFTGFIISGGVAALAGVVNSLERTAADPTAGSTVLLASFAAAIIGGNYLKGGKGSIVGTLIGAASLGMLQVALTISGVQVPVQEIFIGGVLLLAVLTDPSSLRAVWGSISTTFQGIKNSLAKQARD